MPAPRERADRRVGVGAPPGRAPVDVGEPVRLERKVVDVRPLLDEAQQGTARVPGIHEHRVRRQGLGGRMPGIEHGEQHVAHVVGLRLAVAVGARRRIEPIVDHPEAVALRVHVDAGDHADAADRMVRVAAPLPAHERDVPAVVLVEHRVVEDEKAPRRGHQIGPHLLPEVPGAERVAREIARDGIMAERIRVRRQVRHRVVDLAREQELAVGQPCATRGPVRSVRHDASSATGPQRPVLTAAAPDVPLRTS
jgi:hypothetical protein